MSTNITSAEERIELTLNELGDIMDDFRLVRMKLAGTPELPQLIAIEKRLDEIIFLLANGF